MMQKSFKINCSGRITDLIPSGYVDSSTKASMVNAAYFKVKILVGSIECLVNLVIVFNSIIYCTYVLQRFI